MRRLIFPALFVILLLCFRLPVDAKKVDSAKTAYDKGTDAEALTPPSSVHVARTVGRPRLSRISRPDSFSIVGIVFDFINKGGDQVRNAFWRMRQKGQHDFPLSHCLGGRQIL